MKEQFPAAKLHSYEPVSRDTIRAGCRLAFGEDLEPVYHLDQADVIVSLDGDFLAWGPGRLKDARAFAARREIGDAQAATTMNRLYVVECTPSLTGAAADHRLAVSAGDVALVARAIARELKIGEPSAPDARNVPDRLAGHARWIAALARDLAAARGKSLVVVGDMQPPEVHALVHLINQSLENIGKTIDFLPRVDAGIGDQAESLGELVRDMKAGAVDTLIILGGNPAYDAPADLDFAHYWLGTEPS